MRSPAAKYPPASVPPSVAARGGASSPTVSTRAKRTDLLADGLIIRLAAFVTDCWRWPFVDSSYLPVAMTFPPFTGADQIRHYRVRTAVSILRSAVICVEKPGPNSNLAEESAATNISLPGPLSTLIP
jgi:hypothetical protein